MSKFKKIWCPMCGSLESDVRPVEGTDRFGNDVEVYVVDCSNCGAVCEVN